MNIGFLSGFLASRSVFLVCLLSSTLQMASANPIVFESGPKKVQLLELFTSEGCSSCPTAEASFSRLVNDPRLWREVVPVAFHVDYWDRLGWKDSFSSPEWTKRQQTYAGNWKAESVYTPAFVLDGREWRNANVPSENSEALGVLKVTVDGDNAAVTVKFEPASGTADNFEAYVARLGFGINVNVRAGENNGRSLRHDFVVLSLTHQKLNHGAKEVSFASVPPPVSRAQRSAIAAWIAKSGDIIPVQATGGWLP